MDEKALALMRDTGLPVARELAEMLLTRADINNCLISLKVWSEEFSSAVKADDERGHAIGVSLFRDVVTQFVACFDGDTNTYPLVVEEVYPDFEGIAVTFRRLRDLRKSYAAHRYGAARQGVVGIHIDPTTGRYLARGGILATYIGEGEVVHQRLIAIVEQALGFVGARIVELEGRFEKEALAIPPLDRLKLPFARVTPGPEALKKSRGELMRGKEPAPDDEK
ncbi:MAG: hypothetical protein HY834_17235 [Devosia nanyangense]|uniref:Uncharacterized protein n=1 Tax=Devosia nanyangense TaxID=1228055 RepID=A0A933L702_9HYPH|nr:hypothetical protein [Devosia nanyangense]